MRFKCVIFDLDGTLADTLGDIAAAMNHALAARGLEPLSPERYAQLVGNGLRNLAKEALPTSARDDETADAACRDALDYYWEHPADYAKLYPGIAEFIAELRSGKGRGHGIRTAVLSNKPDTLAQTVIGKLFPPYAFDVVIGERPDFPRKPDPAPALDIIAELDASPKETLFMGDSEIDLATARAAGCAFIGASWGFRGRQVLQAAGAGRIIDHPAELLEQLGG
jgi:phosphoglycolate phosphatase